MNNFDISCMIIINLILTQTLAIGVFNVEAKKKNFFVLILFHDDYTLYKIK